MLNRSFELWMAEIQGRVELALERVLPNADIAPVLLHQAMRYAVLGGGKRVRPLLCHAAGELSGANAAHLDVAACAVELIHAYSLVHDDLPCMDDDVLRRGKPTVHVEYDDATALLVGDSLQSLAFQFLSYEGTGMAAEHLLGMVHLLAQAAGSRGMAGGQAIDLASVGKALTVAELEFMHIHKTGALIRAAVIMGARCGNLLPVLEMEALDRYAKYVGLLFQVMDDILDTEASTATLGKTAGKDAADNKPTYVSLLGIGRTRTMVEELRAEALAALSGLGDAARRLRELTDFIVMRQF